MSKVEVRYWLDDGYWNKCIIDDRCNILSYKNSNGFWYEYIMDDMGKIMSYKDSTGEEISYE